MPPKKEASTEHVNKKRRIYPGSFDSIVQIIVGEGDEKRTFTIHKELLCDASPYFVAALKSNFKEGQDQVIEMPEEDVDMFARFQLWLYSGSPLSSHETPLEVEWEDLVHLYIFGEARQMPHLQNSTIDLIIDKDFDDTEIATYSLPHIYKNTAEDSRLRKFFVDLVASEVDPPNSDWFSADLCDHYPRKFLIDLVIAIDARHKKRIPKFRDFRAVRSDYHVAIPTISTEEKRGAKVLVRLRAISLESAYLHGHGRSAS